MFSLAGFGFTLRWVPEGKREAKRDRCERPGEIPGRRVARRRVVRTELRPTEPEGETEGSKRELWEDETVGNMPKGGETGMTRTEQEEDRRTAVSGTDREDEQHG